MDQFGWSKKEAMYYMGILMSVGGVVACITFAVITPLCKRFPEYAVMVWGGFFFMVLGRFVTIPWGSTLAPLAIPLNGMKFYKNKNIEVNHVFKFFSLR